jgi:hypothetical protein
MALSRLVASPHLAFNDADMLKIAAGGEIASWLLSKANDACARLEGEAAFSRSESDALFRDVENRLSEIQADYDRERGDKAVLTDALAATRTFVLSACWRRLVVVSPG